MTRDTVIKITTGVYRVTALFPEEEPLRFFLRKKAGEILEKSVLIMVDNPVSLSKEEKKQIVRRLLKDLEIMDSYLLIGAALENIDERNFETLRDYYRRLEDYFKKTISGGSRFGVSQSEKTKKSVKEEIPADAGETSEIRNKSTKLRLQKIVEIVKQKEEVRVGDLKESFPELSKRTIRRYFDYLVKKGIVQRVGEGKETRYRYRTENLSVGQPVDKAKQ